MGSLDRRPALIWSVFLFLSIVRGFTPPLSYNSRLSRLFSSSTADNNSNSAAAPTSPPPVLNGKRVLPYKIVLAGLQGHRVPAVFCVMDSSFQRGTEGWEKATYIGVTQHLAETLVALHENDASELRVAHVRALSFAFPQANAMQDVADDWRKLAQTAGAKLQDAWAGDVLNYLFDDEDEDEEEDSMEMMAEAMSAMQSSDTIVSPFADGVEEPKASSATDLPFNQDTVDKVLDEVRPYLIADGGNVAIERVDADDKLVILKLEGACGSCASSTVTMQMGIERVLKEKWADVTIRQVEEDEDSKPKELEWQAVETEVNRLKPALMAMGSTVELISVDPTSGEVVIKFIGSSKVRQGLELAIADVGFVKAVNFVEDD